MNTANCINAYKTLKSANDFAYEYDNYVQSHEWRGPNILYELMQDYILPEQTLLDIGIGTGLSSEPFHKSGLKITGIDGSEEMIKICKSKGFTTELKLVNLAGNVVWFEEKKFDNIISHAVFHLVGDLKQIFEQVANALMTNGYFAFTYETANNKVDNYKTSSIPGLFEFENKESGIKLFRHEDEYINRLINTNGFQIVKQTEFLAFVDECRNVKTYFTIVVAKKNGCKTHIQP